MWLFANIRSCIRYHRLMVLHCFTVAWYRTGFLFESCQFWALYAQSWHWIFENETCMNTDSLFADLNKPRTHIWWTSEHSCGRLRFKINPASRLWFNNATIFASMQCIRTLFIDNSIVMLCVSTDTVTIPVICVVLEGGPNTLETVKSAVENGTPAIIVGV